MTLGLPADGRRSSGSFRGRRRAASITGSAGCSWSRLPPTAWARRQRRAEDDGHHRRRAVRRRLSQSGRRQAADSVLGDHGGARRDRARARCRAAGASSTRWGREITKLQPVGGFAAETAGAISLFTATHLGVPVSTTHTITGAIIGVGSIRRLSAVRWGVAGRIVWAWILTIPASAFIAAVDLLGRRAHDRALTVGCQPIVSVASAAAARR